MSRLLSKLFGRSHKGSPARRPVPVRLQIESLEDRQVPSVSAVFAPQIYTPTTSAVTTHPSSGGTNHDLFAIDKATYPGTVTDYHNGQAIHLNANGPQGVFSVSAGVDAGGNAEVFALDGNESLWCYHTNPYYSYWSHDSSGMKFAAISATRDGFVYANLDPRVGAGADVERINGEDFAKWDLGSPGGHGAFGISASRDVYGNDTVFALDSRGNIWNYDAKMNTYGWNLVDARFSGTSDGFASLSAAPNGDVYAVTSSGKLFEEYYFYTFNPSTYLFQGHWAGFQLASGRTFQGNISADTGANGYSEVYAIESGTATAYSYNNGNEAVVDYGVSEISGADGGYFFDVNPLYNGSNEVWSYDPNGYGGSRWGYLGSGVV